MFQRVHFRWGCMWPLFFLVRDWFLKIACDVRGFVFASECNCNGCVPLKERASPLGSKGKKQPVVLSV